MSSFFSPYRHQFIRLGTCVPQVAVTEPRRNADNVLGLLAQGDEARVALMVFPELCLSAYAIDDLLFQDAVLDEVARQVDRLICASAELFPIFVVGAPLRSRGRLYNCGVVIHRGHAAGCRSQGVSAELPRVLRATPLHLRRWSPRPVDSDCRARSPVWQRSFVCRPRRGGFHLSRRDLRGFVGAAAAEHRCSARRSRDPPQSLRQQHHDRQGANAPPAVRFAIGALHRGLCLFRSRCRRIDDRPRLGRPGRYLRMRRRPRRDRTVFDSVRRWRSPMSISDASVRSGCGPIPSGTAYAPSATNERRFARSASTSPRPGEPLELRRHVERFPYVPSDPAMLRENCYEAYNIQVQGLAQRVAATGLKKLVIGVSGGLDSTQALIVSARVDGSAGDAAQRYPRLHFARVCDERCDQGQCVAADAGARRQWRRDRYSAGGAADAAATSATPRPRATPSMT